MSLFIGLILQIFSNVGFGWGTELRKSGNFPEITFYPCRTNITTGPPYTTAYITHPWGGFSCSMAWRPLGCQHRTIYLRKALGEMFPTPTFLASTLLQLWRHQPWKIDPGVCDIHRRIHGTTVLMLKLHTTNFQVIRSSHTPWVRFQEGVSPSKW